LTPRAAAQPRTFSTIESSRDRERLRTVVLHEHEDLAALVAERIIEVIHRETRAKGKVVLGLATGSTPLGVYEELIRRHQAGDVDFARVVTFNLDEYYPMSRESPHSYHRFMWENFFAHVDIARENVHIPDGTIPRERVAEACAAYEEAIRAAGGIDFQMLGIGKTGHIGFNEPGSDAESRTRSSRSTRHQRKTPRPTSSARTTCRAKRSRWASPRFSTPKRSPCSRPASTRPESWRAPSKGEIDVDVAATFLQRPPANTTFYLDLPAGGRADPHRDAVAARRASTGRRG
jgi:glucosamine-6-phosphate deaminase